MSCWSPLLAAARAELRRAQLRRDRSNAYERHLRLPPNSHACDPEAQHPGQMFLTGSRFLEREGNRSTRRKTLQSGWDRLKLRPRTIAELGGVNVEYNANLTSLRVSNWACIWLCAGHKWLRIVTCHQMLKHSEEKRPKNTVQKRTTAFRLNLL